MKKNRLFQWAGLVCLAGFTLMGCKRDEPAINIPGGKGDLAVVSMLTNPDGMTGTSWMQMVDGISPKSVDNSQSVQIGFGMAPLPVLGNDIFTVPDYGQSNTFQKWTRQSDGTLAKGASLELPNNSFATHGSFYNAQKGVLSTMTGRVLVFNPATMQLIGDGINLMPYNPGGYVPFTGTIFFDDDKMYVPLWNCNERRMPQGDPIIDILVFDAKTDKFITRIQDKSTGLTSPGYPYGEQKNIFKDEKGDIYMIAGGAFSTDPKYQTGIVRIKKGTSAIDLTYNWVFNDIAIEGETGKTTWFNTGYYNGGGKLYGWLDIKDYWSDPNKPNWLRDRSHIAVEIDIYNKTVKKLPIPHTCAYATHIGKYDDLLLFSVWGDASSGFYTYDPKTGKASPEAVVKMKGFPFWCYQFK